MQEQPFLVINLLLRNAIPLYEYFSFLAMLL